MGLGRLLTIALAVFAVSGCVHQNGPPEADAGPPVAVVAGPPPPGAVPVAMVPPPAARRPPPASYQMAHGPHYSPAMIPEPPYTLGPGDRLRVMVFGQEGLSNSYTVDVGGKITMPLIGPVPAQGLTTQQLGTSVAARLRQGYIREPHVAVEVETYRPFFILGEVTFPGQYPYVANMTVETAVAIAGGFSPRAKRSMVDLTRTLGPQSARATVPLFTPVRPGDTIMVAERWF